MKRSWITIVFSASIFFFAVTANPQQGGMRATCCLAAQESPAQQAPPGPVAFADVAALFKQRCIMCHSGPQPPLGLRLDSYAGIMSGSNNGPVVMTGKPDESELVRRIRGIRQPRMPMGGPPWLTDEQVALIERWIAAGAPEDSAATRQQPEPEPATASVPPGGQVTYARVESIMTQRCVKCHMATGMMGPAPEGLLLDSYESILTSGERCVVIPGNPDGSELVRRIRGQSLPRMPYGGPPWLDDREIDMISTWIAQGARNAEGAEAPVPKGCEVRMMGTLSGKWNLDGMPLVVDEQTRLQKGPGVGDRVEVRGFVETDGRIHATRIRPR